MRAIFFKSLFSRAPEGYMYFATKEPQLMHPNVKRLPWKEKFFHWPTQIDEAMEWISLNWLDKEMYFAPMLWDNPQVRQKETCLCTPCAWEDLDGCNPDKVAVKPTYSIETSEGRYSALWLFKEPIPPIEAEEISLRIARGYEYEGADQGGWDLTQLLRVPYTVNYKYDLKNPWLVTLDTFSHVYVKEDFDVLPPLSARDLTPDLPFPTPEQLPGDDAETILSNYKTKLTTTTWDLFQHVPRHDWSESMWALTQNLCGAGMTPYEAFVVVRAAACNKFIRDKRREPDQALWKYQIVKAYKESVPDEALAPELVNVSPKSRMLHVDLLTPAEREIAHAQRSILTRYVDWGLSVMDAPKEYHEAGALVLLSSLLAGVLRLPTSFGTIAPNLWVMILADSTLTRKSSSMDLAVDLLMDIDSESMLATDGSIEGIMQALSGRPGKPSLFLRDEFSGMLEAMTKKDYMSGMAEALTKLYDGKTQKRILRKDTITVNKPVLILYAGGIKQRILDLFNYSYVYSGFIPRFIFITASTDTSKLKPLGPPSDKSQGERENIFRELAKIHDHYVTLASVTVGDRVMNQDRTWSVELTPEAWQRYNEIEAKLIAAALESFNPDLFKPTFSRLAGSGLKTAILLAAAKRCEDQVVVELTDILDAFRYCESWVAHSIEVIINIGRSEIEKLLSQVYNSIKSNPGINKSELMNRHHLTSRNANEIFDTLAQRGMTYMDRKNRFFTQGTEEDEHGKRTDD